MIRVDIRRCNISNFTPSNPNPRKFAKSKEQLNPEQILYMYVQLQVNQNADAIINAISMLNYYAQEYPQAGTEIVALSPSGAHTNLIVSFSLGEAREALSGVSERPEAVYGMLSRISMSMYQNRPILSPPPTELEKETWKSFQKKFHETRT